MSLAQVKSPEKEQLTIYEAIACLHHFECQQNTLEIEELIALAKGKKSYLEIGSNFGGTLWRIGRELAPNSKIVCVDLPDQSQTLLEPTHTLQYNCRRLAEMGHDVQLFPFDSHNPGVVRAVRQHGPFDLVFIDGDHSYQGVKKDWEDYGDMGKIVAFHDIAGGTDGCVRFWKELKAEGKYHMVDHDKPSIIDEFKQEMRLGIGVVFRSDLGNHVSLSELRRGGIKAGLPQDAIDNLDYLATQQDMSELAQMLEVVRGSTSLLEVGSRFGGTLRRMAEVLAPKSFVVSVDFPAGDTELCPHKPKEELAKVAHDIRAQGNRCVLVDADSQATETVKRVAQYGPFDFTFIDADHSYAGVKKDWENYGPMSKVVGFHDIAGIDAGCVRFWNELKKNHKHIEFVNEERIPKLGIGIIFREG